MHHYYLLSFFLFGSTLTEWVLLPPVFPAQETIGDHLSLDVGGEVHLRNENIQLHPDLHNLTTMSYGTMFKKKLQTQSEWGISMQDVEDILNESKKLPKSVKEKTNLVKQLEENLMIEAEQKIQALFSSSRQARAKYFHYQSMESALMTISLLLFGVYLSKLILKLLASHYNRYNGYGNVAMMTGIRAPMLIKPGRRKRSIKLQNIYLMHLIDKYSSQFSK